MAGRAEPTAAGTACTIVTMADESSDTPLPDLTWPALLARWTEFARASVAFPKTAEGERWRAAVAPIIALQSVAMALRDLDALAPGGRAGALDMAELLVRRHGAELLQLWRGEPLPGEVDRLLADARSALATARECGVEWRTAGARTVTVEPERVAAALRAVGFEGDALAAVGGVAVGPGAPVLFLRGAWGGPPEPAAAAAAERALGAGAIERRPVRGPRQVYRQSHGGGVRDVVLALDSDLPVGRPLLVWVRQGSAWLEASAGAGAGVGGGAPGEAAAPPLVDEGEAEGTPGW